MSDVPTADDLQIGSRRAVVLVGNPAAPYSRAVRVARTLSGLGYIVEIAAVAAAGLPDREPGGGYEVRRYRASGPWARLGGSIGREDGRVTVARNTVGSGGDTSIVRRVVRQTVWRAVGLLAAARRWVFWPHTVRGWWATLERELEPADLYHACGSLTVAPALFARRRAAKGPGGHRPTVVYDAIDDVFESNNVLDMPRPFRAWHARRETAWARSADVLLTVNDPLADRLGSRWGRRPIPVPNYPEPSGQAGPMDGPEGDLIRRQVALPPTTRIVLFQGRLGPRLGLDEAAEAVLAVPGAAFVLLGFGRGFDRASERDSEPRYVGRHFTLPAQPPDRLLAWTASADVALIPLPAISVNQRLSSPNKFWEALSAGTPVVVPSGLTFMADLVRAHELGVVAASGSAPDLAAAISTVLDVDPDVARARRARIASLARERFTWAVAAAPYLDAIEGLDGPRRRPG